MTYYQFVGAVETKLKEEVGERITVHSHTAVKNNGTRRQGVTLIEKDINISPTIYLEEYYQQFQEGESLKDIVKDILNLYFEIRFEQPWEGEFVHEYPRVKDKIICRLINYKENRELLEEVPFERFLDLAVVFYVLLETSMYGMASMMVRNEHLKIWDRKKGDISCLAYRNSERLLPPELKSMGALIRELSGLEEDGEEDFMYVLSNGIRSYGASVILYEGYLAYLGRYLKENYYILPSSIHEVIMIPESRAPRQEELDDLVKEVNKTQVEKEEVLSDHAYYYDREKGRLML